MTDLDTTNLWEPSDTLVTEIGGYAAFYLAMEVNLTEQSLYRAWLGALVRRGA